MTINQDDVKLYESQRLTDETDGGGRATGKVIIDGEINNLFPDISRLDRTVGDVALRKAFAGVNTANADVYLGAHAIVSAVPGDSLVDVVLFKATSEHDERTDASNFIESYVTKSSTAQWLLLGNQLAGQRQLVGFQLETQPIPEVGTVFCLDDGNNIQYIRITSVEYAVQQYTQLINNSIATLTRRRLDLNISATLDYKFFGGEPTVGGSTINTTDVLTTEVSDAAQFYGASALDADAVTNDFTVKVKDIYSSIVPSAQTEQAVLDQPLYSNRNSYLVSGARRNVVSGSISINSGARVGVYSPTAFMPSSLWLGFGGSAPASKGLANYVDDGSDVMQYQAGVSYFDLEVDHENGVLWITNTDGSAHTENFALSFEPAAVFSGKSINAKEDITIGNRGFVYTLDLSQAKPRPGTVRVSYMALGRWYEVNDNGDGTMGGGGEAGAGSVDYANGSIAITFSAMPDVDTTVIWDWVANVADEIEAIPAGAGDVSIPAFMVQLGAPARPGTLSVDYTAGGTAYNITEGAGDGSLWVDYFTGALQITPDFIPDDLTTIDVAFDEVTAGTGTQNQTLTADVAGSVTGTVPGAPLEPGSVRLSVPFTTAGSYSADRIRLINDDASGNLVNAAGANVGTINYATGVFVATVIYQTTIRYSNMVGLSVLTDVDVGEWETINGDIKIDYQASSPTTGPDTQSFSLPTIDIEIATNTLNPLVPGSLLFSWNGDTYYDANGLVYRNIDAVTGAGTAVGEVNYDTRIVTLSSWTGGIGTAVAIVAGATKARVLRSARFAFRTPGAPLRPQSFQFACTKPDGNSVNVTADASGVLTGTDLTGTINVDTGVGEIIISTNPADDTGASDIPVDLEAADYNAVLITSLPLDAELIGLDPVRLPSNGRVPVYRPGDVVVITHTDTTNIGTPTDGQIIGLTRDHQAKISIIDNLGVALDPAQYTADLLTGTVTFENPVLIQDIGAAALTAPLFIVDRIEHMSVISDVQVTGQLAIISPLSQDFPADETIVSSALTWGDINARYYNMFEQQTWSNSSPNWSDDAEGGSISASYDEVNYPIETYNDGAVTEKWAIVFTSSTTFTITGETLGQIYSGNTSVVAAPQNPNTLNPYFIIQFAGWGTGWVAGNVVRFNTDGCLAPLWIARTVLSGAAEQEDDQFTIQVRGDAD